MALSFATCLGTHGRPFLAAREGDAVVDVGTALDDRFADFDEFLAAGRAGWEEVIARIKPILACQPALALDTVRVQLPFTVADYVDFYACEEHATNAGRILRPDSPGLPPHWKQLPIGYHGRAGTVVPSGTAISRPSGLRGPDDFGPTRRLDFEAELGFVVGVPAPDGRVPTSGFADHVFGVCLVNDWSARDIQRFETVPLGPFLGKSFATSISSWVVPLSELPRCAPVAHPVPSHLVDTEPWALDVTLEVTVNGVPVARQLPVRDLYWTGAQMLAHLTGNGASLRSGDLYATGTVSGAGEGQQGCLLELSWGGSRPVPVGADSRIWLEDGDEVTISCPQLGLEVAGRITPG